MTDAQFESIMTCADLKLDKRASVVPICADHDDECPDVVDKVHCWLYDPARGACPFLRNAETGTAHASPARERDSDAPGREG